MYKRVLFLIFLVFSCSGDETSKETGSGYLMLNVIQSATIKADVEIDDFTLRISASRSEVLKERIADLPEQIELPAGAYTVEVYSIDFSEPKFEMPFYYGKATVEIEPGASKEAILICAQGNAGVRVVWSNDFPEMFSTYQAMIYNADGYLNYSATETRTGYFLPGTVSILVMADGQQINAGTITLAAQDMVTANLQPRNIQRGNISFTISIDNTLNLRDVDIIVDPEQPNSQTNPYTIAQAIERQGENEAWVTGYIVGSKPSTGYDFVNGTWQNTNIVIADNISETSDDNVIFVELPTAALRNNLGITGADNHERLHRQVVIKGNLRTYQSRAGLRDITDYSFK